VIGAGEVDGRTYALARAGGRVENFLLKEAQSLLTPLLSLSLAKILLRGGLTSRNGAFHSQKHLHRWLNLDLVSPLRFQDLGADVVDAPSWTRGSFSVLA
jgi:hypothetical protein